MELTIRGLRVFVAVEESGSIAIAAERLKASPSGVSQQITNIEKLIGAPLFDRQHRPLRLTPAGHILNRHAHRILDGVSDALSELAAIDTASLPELTVAILDDLDATLTPALVAELQRRYRGCFIYARSGWSSRVTDLLESREANIAVSTVLPGDVKSYRIQGILTEPFILVAAKNTIRPNEDIRDQITKLPYVQYSETIPIGRTIAQHLKRVRFSPPRHYAFEASRSVLQMVVQTGGWALTSPLNLLDAVRFIDQVDTFKMPFPQTNRTVYLISREGELGSIPDMLAKRCRELVQASEIQRFREIAPHLADQMVVLND